MSEHLLIGLAGILVLGIGSQWLASQFRLPSILLLLLFGFIAGPVTGLLHPDDLLGDLLFPVVSLSVAIILFEGGLTLRLGELPQIGGAIFKLISLGALITWAVGTVAAHYILGLGWAISLLLGAILIVTGPTVIGPLLRQIRPQGQSAALLKWEGILIDPVGAVLAVLVFEVIIEGKFSQVSTVIAGGVVRTLVIGLVLGFLGAAILVILLRRYWVSDHLQNGVALLFAISAFAISNELQHEAGLLTVTVMGVVLANQHWVTIRHIVEFKENLRVLLIGSLFILLAARLELNDVLDLGWQGIVFLVILIVIARPLSVFISTWGSSLTFKEKLFVSWMAPRGIVAASVASVFAFELSEAGFAEADQLVSVTFLVIVGTVSLYGLTAGPLARYLGLSEQNPQGVLLVGAHAPARAIGSVLQKQGFKVLLLDTNEKNVRRGQRQDLKVLHGNALAEDILEDLDLTGIGRLLALTSNDEVNALATLHFPELFGRSEVYQLPMAAERNAQTEAAQYLRGRFLFAAKATHNYLTSQFEEGGRIEVVELTQEFDYLDFQNLYDNEALPLFLITNDKKQLNIYTVDYQPLPRVGQILIAMVPSRFDTPEEMEVLHSEDVPA